MKCIPYLLVLFSLLGVNLCHGTGPTATKGDVLAKVGNHEITREMLDHIIATIPEENRVPFLTPDGRKKILDEVVSFTLFAEAAKAEGMDREPAIQTRLQHAQTEYLAKEYFRRHLAKAPLVSEKELRDYYKSHISEFTPPEEIKARHILLKTQSQANRVLREIKGGIDFAELAKKNSIDPTAAKGGRLELQDGREWLPRGSFESSFEHALFGISTGHIGGPIKTQFGWHMLKVEDRRQPKARSFVEVRNMIKSRLEDEKRAEMHKKVTADLKQKIPVEIK
jgi:peptidyl-prolyl cis-trans isomerase C